MLHNVYSIRSDLMFFFNLQYLKVCSFADPSSLWFDPEPNLVNIRIFWI